MTKYVSMYVLQTETISNWLAELNRNDKAISRKK
jgi:hypothetical protein